MSEKSLGARLAAARVKAGLTQTEVARRLEVPDATVCRWETDAHAPGWDNLKRLAALLDVSLDSLAK